jgi:hypothetical protein
MCRTYGDCLGGAEGSSPGREFIVVELLLPFVDQHALISRMTWGPLRFGNDSSIATQFERALSQSFAIALHQNENLPWSTYPNGVGHPI